jgi:hypothetical protein
MRKLAILAGLLLAAALIPGAPAKADIGCQCLKAGAPSACVATMLECNATLGGICIAPCAYTPAPPKMMKHHAKRHHTMKHKTAKKPAAKKKAKKM